MRLFLNKKNFPISISIKGDSLSVAGNAKFELSEEESYVPDINRYLKSGWIKELTPKPVIKKEEVKKETKPKVVVDSVGIEIFEKPKKIEVLPTEEVVEEKVEHNEIEVSTEDNKDNIIENVDDIDETINNNTEELLDNEESADDLPLEEPEKDLADTDDIDYMDEINDFEPWNDEEIDDLEMDNKIRNEN
jgi:hypothetical protein